MGILLMVLRSGKLRNYYFRLFLYTLFTPGIKLQPFQQELNRMSSFPWMSLCSPDFLASPLSHSTVIVTFLVWIHSRFSHRDLGLGWGLLAEVEMEMHVTQGWCQSVTWESKSHPWVLKAAFELFVFMKLAEERSNESQLIFMLFCRFWVISL